MESKPESADSDKLSTKRKAERVDVHIEGARESKMSGVTRAELVAEINNFANMCQETCADITSSTLVPKGEDEYNMSVKVTETKGVEEDFVAAMPGAADPVLQGLA